MHCGSQINTDLLENDAIKQEAWTQRFNRQHCSNYTGYKSQIYVNMFYLQFSLINLHVMSMSRAGLPAQNNVFFPTISAYAKWQEIINNNDGGSTRTIH